MSSTSPIIPNDVLSALILRFPFDINDYLRDDQSYRIFYHLEHVVWFCMDHCSSLFTKKLREADLLQFCTEFCRAHDLLSKYFTAERLESLFRTFKKANHHVRRYGCIIINQTFDALLMNTRKNEPWSFPKGKIEDNEEPLQCALRETYEETGLDLTNYAPQNPTHFASYSDGLIWFIIPGVSDTLRLEPQELGEVDRLEWVPVSYLLQSINNPSPSSFPLTRSAQHCISFVEFY